MEKIIKNLLHRRKMVLKSYKIMTGTELIDGIRQPEIILNSKQSDEKEDSDRELKFFLRNYSDTGVMEKKEETYPETEKFASLNVMAAGIAHNFNNILTGIMGFAQLATMKLSPDSPAKQNIEEVTKSSRRAAKLIKKILLYLGAVPFTFKILQISEIVRETVPLLESSINKNCRLVCDLAEDLPSFEGDGEQIKQIIMNLVINASEAIEEEKGIITVKTGTIKLDETCRIENSSGKNLYNGLYIYLEVTDRGCGIPEKIQNKIFDPFFTTRYIGRGLGLPSVLGIVRSHRGAISVKSEPGQGTVIKVFFPVFKKTCKHETNTESRIDREVVLVVGEEKKYPDVARFILERAGFAVMTAASRHKAVDIFRSHSDKISTVIIDMSDISGGETFREFYNIRNDIKLLISCDYNKQNSIAPFAYCAHACFIRKPYLVKELIEAIKK